MNKKFLIIMILVFFVIATYAFAHSISYDNVEITWGGNSLQLRNLNERGVTVTFAVELVNPSNEKDTKVVTNITYSIEAGGGRTWTVPRPYNIKEILNIIVNKR
ncbi:MAG: hypothetical protein FWB86_11865 [Treponema sp.]|nr:hypothetical protein [Treponema sp.]